MGSRDGCDLHWTVECTLCFDSCGLLIADMRSRAADPDASVRFSIHGGLRTCGVAGCVVSGEYATCMRNKPPCAPAAEMK